MSKMDEILQAFAVKTHEAKPGQDETLNFTETKQAILQWAEDTLLDDSDIPNVMIAMEHNRQRETLKREGWKE